MTLETKLKIITDFEAGRWAVIRNVEADLHCYKEVLTKMKKVRIQPTLDSFFQEDKRFTAVNFCTLNFFNKIIKILHIFLKFNSIHICMYKISI
jgi:hypothetical protein